MNWTFRFEGETSVWLLTEPVWIEARVNSKFSLNNGVRFENEDGLREIDNRQTAGFDRAATLATEPFRRDGQHARRVEFLLRPARYNARRPNARTAYSSVSIVNPAAHQTISGVGTDAPRASAPVARRISGWR